MINDKLINKIKRKQKLDEFFLHIKANRKLKLLRKTALKMRTTEFQILKSEFKESDEIIIKILNILKSRNILTYEENKEDNQYINIYFTNLAEEEIKYKKLEPKKEEKSLIKTVSDKENEVTVTEKSEEIEELSL